jgi:hypothetical protein
VPPSRSPRALPRRGTAGVCGTCTGPSATVSTATGTVAGVAAPPHLTWQLRVPAGAEAACVNCFCPVGPTVRGGGEPDAEWTLPPPFPLPLPLPLPSPSLHGFQWGRLGSVGPALATWACLQLGSDRGSHRPRYFWNCGTASRLGLVGVRPDSANHFPGSRGVGM